MSSAICFNLDQSKILSSGNGLKRTLGEKKKMQATSIFHSKTISLLILFEHYFSYTKVASDDRKIQLGLYQMTNIEN